MPIPRERRARVTQSAPILDTSNRAFMPFSIDIRWGGSEWRENDVVGCVYVKTGEIFVKRGDQWRPGAFLLGKAADPVQGVCEAPPPKAA